KAHYGPPFLSASPLLQKSSDRAEKAGKGISRKTQRILLPLRLCVFAPLLEIRYTGANAGSAVAASFSLQGPPMLRLVRDFMWFLARGVWSLRYRVRLRGAEQLRDVRGPGL